MFVELLLTYINILLFSLCMRCLFTSLTYHFIVPTTSRILVFWIHLDKTQVKCQLTMWSQLPAGGLCCVRPRPPHTNTHTLSHYRLISCLLSPIHYQNKGKHAEKINRSHPIYNWTNRLFMDSHSILSQMGMHTHIYTHGKWFESVLCSKGRRLQQRINS